MIKNEDFKSEAYSFIDWISGYFNHVENFPVRSQVNYGDIKKRLPEHPPYSGEPIEAIFNDFKNVIIPGVTHWQSPRNFAYFPANSSIPSVLAEILTAALGVQAMKWITSPAATELEEVVMDWLRQMIDLPEKFKGVIYDTASIASLSAVVAARERITGFKSNSFGTGKLPLRYYCSSETHSSIDKAIRIAGIGSENLVKVGTDIKYGMDPDQLEKSIKKDLGNNLLPTCIIATIGTTGTCAIDPVGEIAEIAKKYKVWLHIDAAFAGSALVLPEFRKEIHGLENADSIVFNPHKWMFTNFDCSVFFIKDRNHLQKTFSMVPEYLKTPDANEASDYSNWSLQLGRRFRSLKLWFVIRNFGVDEIKERIREHINLAIYFEQLINNHKDFELVVSRNLAVVCFRYHPEPVSEKNDLNKLNFSLLETINKTGKAYLSHTVIDDKFTLRFVCAQTNTKKTHVTEAFNTIVNCSKQID
ncbi:MAG: hypothetical protein JW894_10955 [Bacteroidales bacterium]|nr:hypothetical protein [Bacteroidales bacterium]